MENQQPKFELKEIQIEEKREKWDEKMAQMLKPDVYGYVLDEKIRETIVALNLLEINTTQSDQGNYSDSPWIQFEATAPENYYVGESELRAKVLEQKKLQPEVMDESSSFFDRSTQVDVWADSRDELMKNQAKYTPEFLKYLEDTQKMVEKMQSLIDEYYSYKTNLENEKMKIKITYPYADPHYASYLKQLPLLTISVSEDSKSEDERKLIVLQTQAEFLKFTEYLKSKYFQKE